MKGKAGTVVAALALLALGGFGGFIVGWQARPANRLAALPVEERRALLREAVRTDLPEATRLLLPEFDVNAALDGEGMTLLLEAADLDATRSADVLLAAGADPYGGSGGGGTALDWIKSEAMWRVFEKHARPVPEIEGIPRPVFDRVLPREVEGPVLVSFQDGPPPAAILRLLEEKYPGTGIVTDEASFPKGGRTLDLTFERVSPDRVRWALESRKKQMILSGYRGEGTDVERHGFWVKEEETWWDE